MGTVTNLLDYRRAKGLPPPAFKNSEQRKQEAKERLLRSYAHVEALQFLGHLNVDARLRLLCTAAARQVVAAIKDSGRAVYNNARLQFFAVDHHGLVVRINLVGAADELGKHSTTHRLSYSDFEPLALSNNEVMLKSSSWTPVLTLAMTDFYNL